MPENRQEGGAPDVIVTKESIDSQNDVVDSSANYSSNSASFKAADLDDEEKKKAANRTTYNANSTNSSNPEFLKGLLFLSIVTLIPNVFILALIVCLFSAPEKNKQNYYVRETQNNQPDDDETMQHLLKQLGQAPSNLPQSNSSSALSGSQLVR